MSEPNGNLAFPSPEYNEEGYLPAHPGMTLRQYYAAHAPDPPEQYIKDCLGEMPHVKNAIAAWNFEYADAMLKAERENS